MTAIKKIKIFKVFDSGVTWSFYRSERMEPALWSHACAVTATARDVEQPDHSRFLRRNRLLTTANRLQHVLFSSLSPSLHAIKAQLQYLLCVRIRVSIWILCSNLKFSADDFVFVRSPPPLFGCEYGRRSSAFLQQYGSFWFLYSDYCESTS